MAESYTILKRFLLNSIEVSEALGHRVDPYGDYAEDQDPVEPPHDDCLALRTCFCLLGAVEFTASGRPNEILGLTDQEASALEAGFCGWDRPEEFQDSLYRLGAEIGRKITKKLNEEARREREALRKVQGEIKAD